METFDLRACAKGAALDSLKALQSGNQTELTLILVTPPRSLETITVLVKTWNTLKEACQMSVYTGGDGVCADIM